MKFVPSKESLKQHRVPEWFHDAKLGIFIHWGLFSVPAFAAEKLTLGESQKRGVSVHMKNNPYAEWYLNSLMIEGSPTQRYHRENYGDDFSYERFAEIFNEEIKKWAPEDMVDLFIKAGAKYVVLVTKHHDGFLLWQSKYPNPKKENYYASRDIVGELTESVKGKGLRMGLYYSGALDWSWNPHPIIDEKSWLTNGPSGIDYTKYANNHWYELIDKFDPIILWNDIGYPPNTNVYEIFAYFYNKHPDGVINDRWIQYHKSDFDHPPVRHKDFSTPEYRTMKEISELKWESTRGIGYSFGYNKMETEQDYLKPEELIRMFIDIVSKNGNLLLNIGPMADGTIPELQKKAISIKVRSKMQNRRVFSLPNLKVEIVRPLENSEFCSRCTRLRLTSNGFLKPCLMVFDNLVDVLTPLRNGASDEKIKKLFVEAVKRRKPYFQSS